MYFFLRPIFRRFYISGIRRYLNEFKRIVRRAYRTIITNVEIAERPN